MSKRQSQDLQEKTKKRADRFSWGANDVLIVNPSQNEKQKKAGSKKGGK